MDDEFTGLEHTGWQCVADKYAMQVFARPDGLLARQPPGRLEAIRAPVKKGSGDMLEETNSFADGSASCGGGKIGCQPVLADRQLACRS
jgi:hypothetical protein